MASSALSLQGVTPSLLIQSAGAAAYRKGMEYHLQHRVEVERLDAEHAVARVQGSATQPYRVDLDKSDADQIEFSCDCAAFDGVAPCKHVVAAVLEIRANQGKAVKIAWESTLNQALEAATASRKAPSASSAARASILIFSLQKRSAYWSPHLYSLPMGRLADEEPDDSDAVAAVIARDRLSQQATRVKTVGSGAARFVNLNEDERRAAAIAGAMAQQYGYGYYSYGMPNVVAQVLPLLGPHTLVYSGTEADPLKTRLRILSGADTRAALRLRNQPDGGIVVDPVVQSGDETIPLLGAKAEFLLRDPVPYLLTGEHLIALAADPSPVFEPLLAGSEVRVPAGSRALFVERYLLPFAEEIPIVGDAIAIVDRPDTGPIPHLYLSEEGGAAGRAKAGLRAHLRFAYGDLEVPYDPNFPRESIRAQADAGDTLVRVRRRADEERKAWEALANYGLKRDTQADEPGRLTLRARVDVVDFLMRHAPRLVEAGYVIYGEETLTQARVNRSRPTLSLRVSSGIDWFDVEADVTFGDVSASLKEVRKAIKRRERYIKLADGSIGLLPEDWLVQYRHLFALSEETETGLRLSTHHALLLDQAIEDSEGGAHAADAEFSRRKQQLRDGFSTIIPRALPSGLNATLYPYQKAGFDWLHFLHEYGFGGCLADDMGLGKTITALSFLLSLRRSENGEAPHAATPDLIVVPRSLLFNWEREAQRFTPDLKVLIYADGSRPREASALDGYDLVLTTYGILLRDIESLRDYPFHYAILDEAQAIKNPLSQTARAARMLGAEHRLTLTGTPVENSALELWSQFAFLNPGLLGSLEGFRQEFAGAIERKGDEQAAETLRSLIQPFLLRRTKDQVAPELPERTERIHLTDMDAAQSKLYARVRDYYRSQVLGLLSDGSPGSAGGAQMKILEGLLRLRQICNHPRLVEPDFKGESAKFDALLETLETLRSEGHKALVFSQFVQMLTLIRDALDARGIPYVYLDGRTRDRQARVDKFQNEPELPFFLISLKAGGVGLNLTAADYVLHVDPWWNPAVEQQATDRAHRIGQTKPVFVDKFIVKDSVEEKILTLQERKRNLANQLISTEESFFKSLTRNDIEALFS